jgi:hypothetical protein
MRALPTNKADADWFSERTSLYPQSEIKGVKFLDDEENVIAMVVYTDWTLNAVQIHVVVSNPVFWANKEAIKEIFDFPYRQGRKIIYAIVPSERVLAIAVLKMLGFQFKYDFENAWKQGVGMILYSMDLDSCKWRAH